MYMQKKERLNPTQISTWWTEMKGKVFVSRFCSGGARHHLFNWSLEIFHDFLFFSGSSGFFSNFLMIFYRKYDESPINGWNRCLQKCLAPLQKPTTFIWSAFRQFLYYFFCSLKIDSELVLFFFILFADNFMRRKIYFMIF